MSVGLAADATAVSAARGLAVPRVPAGSALRMALVFGVFHVGMPLLGWCVGAQVGRRIQAYDHWVAFLILGCLGGKMIHEAVTYHLEQEVEAAPADPFRLSLVLPLAVGISLDAFAIGFTLPLLGASLVPALLSMGLVTVLMSWVGVYAGQRFGAALGKRVDVMGGLILIGLGTKILFEHLRDGI
ncbi:MAG: manganese efflux pump MntP family protein [Myxococcales bacterium]|nr:manganese efflux pump MntP family protein [Myxococcales bacterium]